MPVYRFSTRSSLPIPCLPANLFNFESISEEELLILLIDIGSPDLNSIEIISSSSGACFKEEVLCQISSGAFTDGSSNISPS